MWSQLGVDAAVPTYPTKACSLDSTKVRDALRNRNFGVANCLARLGAWAKPSSAQITVSGTLILTASTAQILPEFGAYRLRIPA
jgi:hypothetical protein